MRERKTNARRRQRPARTARPAVAGFSLIEVLIAGVLIAIVAMAGALYLVRRTQSTDWVKDRVFANQRALSILAELRAGVAGADGVLAATLDRFDDGPGYQPALTIQALPEDPDVLVAPDHPVSGNVLEQDTWRWLRQISVRPFGSVEANDRRLCAVRIFRRRPGEAEPGTLISEAASLIQSDSDSPPMTQAYDLYVLAIDNVPGWAVDADQRRSYVQGAISDLEAKNPGLALRVHWITRLGYGRDAEYAPYANEERLSTDATPWTYVYPGRLPDTADGDEARYYDGPQIGARINLDGESTPSYFGDHAVPEPFTDGNANGVWDEGELFTDTNGNGRWDAGNPLPYALADQHNHCLRWPEAEALFAARVAAGLEDPEAPTWRLLLDHMVAEPQRYHNALILNTHGSLLPMPPVRNVSDPCKSPEAFPGWRAVAHPERLHAPRVAGSDALSIAPVFRVYAWKASFESPEVITTQEEPYVDANGSGTYDPGESFEDWNENGVWDLGVPITVSIPGGDFGYRPNGATNPSLVVSCLSGGIDADGQGGPDEYQPFRQAPRYPEAFEDLNQNGLCEIQEPFLDLDGDGLCGALEPHQELDGNGVRTAAGEMLADTNGSGAFDDALPAEPFTDANGNGRWDAAEPFWDRDGDGAWTPPTAARSPWVPWNPADYGNAAATDQYVASYGEPFGDLDGDGRYDAAEPFVDRNGNGLRDGGFRRGEMWFGVDYDAANDRTVLTLHGTPLVAPALPSLRGLHADGRLYDMDYVPCPTPTSASGADRYGRDLSVPGVFPKNTARWRIELPVWALRQAYATAPDRFDGDAEDRVVTLQTRWGTDLGTGTMWPLRNQPANLTSTYCYFCADAGVIPFSERYQFQGDPRHAPTMDTDALGGTFPNAYNWFFDDLVDAVDARPSWLAFDPARLHAGWMGRTDVDAPRFLAWLRTALTRTEAVFTQLPGFSFRYLSLGGDVGYGPGEDRLATPMDGTPFGLVGAAEENTFLDEGTQSIRGSRKLVQANDGADAPMRAGGAWWSKPWLGELCPDAVYASQWAPWGNLRAARVGTPSTFRQVRRDAVGTLQQPLGTRLAPSPGELGYEGCTSFFNTGAKAGDAFHHQDRYKDGALAPTAFELGTNYGVAFPTASAIPWPWTLAGKGDGGVGPEFPYTDDYPRYGSTLGPAYYAKDGKADKEQGASVVRLLEPGGARAARVIVAGNDLGPIAGPSAVSRFALVSLLHTLLVEGLPGTPQRIRQVPQVQLLTQNSLTTLKRPTSIPIRWRTAWLRWDGRRYTEGYPDPYAESTADVVYVLTYSADGGRTWINMLDGTPADPDVLPLRGGVADPVRTLVDMVPDGDESWTWTTSASVFPQGTYRVRVSAFRRGEALHHAFHEEQIHVAR